jgi:serine/threonine-protein kinase
VRDIFQQIPDAFSQAGSDHAGDVVVTTSALPEQQEWERYVNGRFQFGVDVPPGFVRDEPGPANGDGDSFSDGTASMIVYGSNNALEETAESGFDDALNSAPGTVTYKALLDDGFAFSGIDGEGRVYYERHWIGEGSLNVLTWTYPREEAGYADMVDRAVRSFIPGDLTTSH